MEYAMMERHVRRWRLAVLDLQGVSFLSRFTLVVLAAGALERSFRSVLVILVGLALMAVLAIAITAVLTAVFMPIRMRARKKAKRESAANAVSEAMVWGEMFAAVLSVLWMISFAVASYKLDQLRAFVWPIPPNPFALAIFVAVTIMTFLSHWLLRPVQRRLFAQRPGYYTERVEGGLRITFVDEKEEPLL
jgi:MFS family permease